MKKPEAVKKAIGGLKLAELAKIVSTKIKVEEMSVRKALKVTMGILKEQIESGERTRVAGLGVFSRMPSKEDGGARIRFIPLEIKPGKPGAPEAD
jgi:hypothetical protein